MSKKEIIIGAIPGHLLEAWLRLKGINVEEALFQIWAEENKLMDSLSYKSNPSLALIPEDEE